MLPNFLVIGAPRCGTTWIHTNLLSHPQVFVPAQKEVHFFDRDYEKGIEYYESAFAGWRGEPAIGESTPAYLSGAYSSHDIPSMIKRDLPDARLVVSLRNPVERAYSRYWNSVAMFKKNASLSFEDKLKDRPEFIREGFYADQLARYYEHFPKEQILVLLYDDLVSAPAAFMSAIYSFLGVDASFDARIGAFRASASSGKNRLARLRALWLVSRALQRAKLYGAADKIRKWNSRGIPPIDGATRRTLVETYAEANRKLEEVIGRDLSAWNRVGEETPRVGAAASS
jgi:hypothetical protein